jgi:hypothetical protein
MNAWFGTGAQIVSWFRKRREVSFCRRFDHDQSLFLSTANAVDPPLVVRLHHPVSDNSSQSLRFDIVWRGITTLDVDALLTQTISSATPRTGAVS